MLPVIQVALEISKTQFDSFFSVTTNDSKPEKTILNIGLALKRRISCPSKFIQVCRT